MGAIGKCFQSILEEVNCQILILLLRRGHYHHHHHQCEEERRRRGKEAVVRCAVVLEGLSLP